MYHRRCIVIYLTRDELPFYTRHYSEYTIVNATSWLVDRLSRFSRAPVHLICRFVRQIQVNNEQRKLDVIE